MQNSVRERMLELASQAVVEPDHAKFIALIQELNQLLEPRPSGPVSSVPKLTD